jgi:hypothetical protein
VHFEVIHGRRFKLSMGMSFFCSMPSKQGLVQGRFKLAHLRLSPGTIVNVYVRRFETPTALDYGRASQKKDIPMLLCVFSL